MYPGASKFSRNFDAVIIYLQEANEFNFIKDLLTQYKEAPVKAFIGKDLFGDAASFKAKAYTVGQADALFADLTTQFNQLNEVMQKVFKSFDKDNSGFIDINELKEVSQELGRPLDAAELEECMKDLD